MTIKKILWPTDFSENSYEALPYLNSLAENYQAEIHVLYVVEDVRQFDHIYGDANPEFLKEFQEKILKAGEHLQEEICQKRLNACPGYKKHIVVGDPAREILNLIEKEDVDLVILATHGHGAAVGEGVAGHFHIGSVSEKIIKNSFVPVLVINPYKKERSLKK